MLKEAYVFLKTRKKANLTMAAASVLVFLIMSVLGNTEDVSFMLRFGACYTPLILKGQYWRLITAMFLHFGFVHLIYNMICLVSLGDILESIVGSVRYLIIYFIGGIAGNLLSLLWEQHTGSYAVSAGASGAIFAVIGAVFSIMLRNRNRVSAIMLRRMAIMTLLMVVQGFTEAGTDNAAHIGGLVTGFLLALLLGGRRNRR